MMRDRMNVVWSKTIKQGKRVDHFNLSHDYWITAKITNVFTDAQHTHTTKWSELSMINVFCLRGSSCSDIPFDKWSGSNVKRTRKNNRRKKGYSSSNWIFHGLNEIKKLFDCHTDKKIRKGYQTVSSNKWFFDYAQIYAILDVYTKFNSIDEYF